MTTFKRPQQPDIKKVPSKRKFEINELPFTYRKATKPVMMCFIEFEQACQNAMRDAAKTVEDTGTETKYGKMACYDRWDYYIDLLKFIAMEPEAAAIMPEDLDMTEAEKAIENFLPESIRLAATLIGFSNTLPS